MVEINKDILHDLIRDSNNAIIDQFLVMMLSYIAIQHAAGTSFYYVGVFGVMYSILKTALTFHKLDQYSDVLNIDGVEAPSYKTNKLNLLYWTPWVIVTILWYFDLTPL